MVIVSNLVQPENAYSPIVSKPSFSSIELKDVHPAKALSPILFKLSGILTFSKDFDHLNAQFPIFVTVFGRSISLIEDSIKPSITLV